MKQSLIILSAIIFLLLQKNIFPQYEVYNYFQGDMPAIDYNNQLGGYALPSEGTIKVLFIFAKFPDDGYTGDSRWPLGGDPQNYTTWLDETWTGNPTSGSMTDYFNQMSLGKLHFIGKEVSVTTLHTRQYYLDNAKKRYDIHKEIIQQQLDPAWDFGQFDNWTKTYDPNTQWYIHTNTPDGKVEFICIVWRNIAMEFDAAIRNQYMQALDMGWSGSLGSGLNYSVDNGQRTIVMYPYGSGATIADYYYKDAFRFSIHEFAHYLLGGNQFHNGHGFWAMLSGYEVRSYMVNAYERYRLGWCNLITVNSTTQTISNATLPDFITTGVAYRIDINPALNQFFFIENHQKISIWDKCSKTDYPDDKGLFAIRQDRQQSTDYQSADWMWMITADGRYNWEVNQWTPNLWGDGELPVFKKLNANRETGYHELEFVPFTYNGQNYDPYEIIFLEDQYGNPYQYPTRQGRGKDAFRLGFNEVFSPWSNPNSQNKDRESTGIGLKINSVINGLVTFDIYVNQSVTAPPSKPQNLKSSVTPDYHPKLTWDKNLEPDMTLYKVYRSYNPETNFAQIGTTNQNPLLNTITYIDYTIDVPHNGHQGGATVYYRVTAVDNQSLESVKSDYVNSMSDEFIDWKPINSNNNEGSTLLSLAQNYPNPFNPSTSITYTIPFEGSVTLRVFNLLGEVVSELVNETKSEGRYEAVFDASGLSSGMYFYSIDVTSSDGSKHLKEVKKMLLQK